MINQALTAHFCALAGDDSVTIHQDGDLYTVEIRFPSGRYLYTPALTLDGLRKAYKDTKAQQAAPAPASVSTRRVMTNHEVAISNFGASRRAYYEAQMR